MTEAPQVQNKTTINCQVCGKAIGQISSDFTINEGVVIFEDGYPAWCKDHKENAPESKND